MFLYTEKKNDRASSALARLFLPLFLSLAIFPQGCAPAIERDYDLENRVKQQLTEAASETVICGIPCCTEPAEQTFSLPDGTALQLCSTHFEEIKEQQESAGSYTIPDGPPAEEHLCEVCGQKSILSITDESGETRYYCREHFTLIADDIASLGS